MDQILKNIDEKISQLKQKKNALEEEIDLEAQLLSPSELNGSDSETEPKVKNITELSMKVSAETLKTDNVAINFIKKWMNLAQGKVRTKRLTEKQSSKIKKIFEIIVTK